MKSNVILEFQGNQVEVKDIVEMAKKTWKDSGNKVSDLKDMRLYVKPEENAIYYVFNDSVDGRLSLGQFPYFPKKMIL